MGVFEGRFTDAANLRRAAANGQLQKVWGVGPKRVGQILDTLCTPEVRQERLEL